MLRSCSDSAITKSSASELSRSRARLDHCDSCRHMARYSRASSSSWFLPGRAASRPLRPVGDRAQVLAEPGGWHLRPPDVPAVVGELVVVAGRRGDREVPLLADVRVAGREQVELADAVLVRRGRPWSPPAPTGAARSSTAPPGTCGCTARRRRCRRRRTSRSRWPCRRRRCTRAGCRRRSTGCAASSMNLRRMSSDTLPRSASRSRASNSPSFISGSMNSTRVPEIRSRHRYCQFTQRPSVSASIGGTTSASRVSPQLLPLAALARVDHQVSHLGPAQRVRHVVRPVTIRESG